MTTGATGTPKLVTTSTYAADSVSFDNVINCDSTSNAISITLPAPTGGRTILIQDITGQAATKNVTLLPNSGETLNGSSSFVLSQNRAFAQCVADGSKWLIQTNQIPSASISRSLLDSTGKNWCFLGQATASTAVRTSTVTWTGTYAQLWFEYFVAGCSGSAIPRLIVGPTAGLSETGTTFCTSIIEGVTVNVTSVSVPGWPVAVTAGTVARYGHIYVKNIASSVKLMTGHGQHSGTAPTTPPTQVRLEGMFNDSTNLINNAELAVYAALTGTAISALTMNAGTYLNVWGRNSD